MRTFLVIIFALLISILIGKGLDFSLVGAWWAGRAAILNPTPEGNLVEEIKKKNEDLLAAGPREELRQLRKRQEAGPLSPVEMERVIQLEREAEAARGTAEKWTRVSKKIESVKNVFTDSIPLQIQDNLHSLRQVGCGGVDGVVHWHTITSVEIDAGENILTLRYPFYEGVAKGKLDGHTFSGVWRQSGGWGKFGLEFSPDFSRADGWWARSDAPGRRYFLTIK